MSRSRHCAPDRWHRLLRALQQRPRESLLRVGVRLRAGAPDRRCGASPSPVGTSTSSLLDDAHQEVLVSGEPVERDDARPREVEPIDPRQNLDGAQEAVALVGGASEDADRRAAHAAAIAGAVDPRRLRHRALRGDASDPGSSPRSTTPTDTAGVVDRLRGRTRRFGTGCRGSRGRSRVSVVAAFRRAASNHRCACSGVSAKRESSSSSARRSSASAWPTCRDRVEVRRVRRAAAARPRRAAADRPSATDRHRTRRARRR